MSYKIKKHLKNIETPIYVCEEELLENNLKLLKSIQDETNIKILLALKGFAFSPLLNMITKYLKGSCASGLYEAKYAKEFVGGEIHTYSPAFKESEFEEIANLSNHIVFNNFNQLSKYIDKTKSSNSIGLRINPEVSTVDVDIYNPCGVYSRLGTTKKEFEKSDKSLLKYIDGFHFHALCEQDSDALDTVLQKFELNFKEYFKDLKWVNFGGGHHITKKDYDIERLIKIIKEFKNRYPHLEVYMELGEAVGWQTGTLVGTILDITKNDIDIAILDVSAEAHMPDTLAMPYTPEVLGGKIGSELKYKYRFAGNSCLAGDIIGDYSFNEPLKVGDKVVFEDQIHYTIVKNNTLMG